MPNRDSEDTKNTWENSQPKQSKTNKQKNLDRRAELWKVLGNKMSPNSRVNSVFHTGGVIFNTHLIEKHSSYIHKLKEMKMFRKQT